jgi:hypothetical protein
VSAATDYFPYDHEGLIQILHFRLQVAKAAQRRAKWFGGRLYNHYSGENAKTIPLSGTHLRQTLLAARITPPDLIDNNEQYALRLDTVETAL